jgi:hypothetical protein
MNAGKGSRIHRVGIRHAAIALITMTALSIGIAGSASATNPTLTPVGSFVSNSGIGLTTAAATLVNPGDVLAIWVQAQNQSTAGHVTGIVSSGTGAIGTALDAITYTTVQHPGNDDEIWYAPVTALGATTLTFTWSGTPSSVDLEYSTQEFQPSAASTYSVDVANSLEVSAPSTTIQFPGLTPAGAGELYLGYNSNNTNGGYGSPTTGYTVNAGGTGDAIIFDAAATSSLQNPTATAPSNPTTQSAIGAMIFATAGSGSDTVTFNSEGGSAVSSQTGANGSTITLPAAPTYTGFTFNGWFTNPSGGSALTSPYTLNVSATLYAQYTPNATDTITFNSEGGSAVSSQSGPNGSAITLPAAPTYAGHTFNGWFAAPSGGSALTSPYTLTGSATLYAQYNVNSSGGGGGGVAPTTSTLVVTAGNISVTSGGAVTPTVTVSGLNAGDTAVTSGITYTYAGTGGTTYVSSTAAPTAVGTYSITPSGGAVTVAPSGDQSNYAATYTYVPGTLTIAAVTSPPPVVVVFHATRVIGAAVRGRTVVISIDGTGFYGRPRITSSSGRKTIARVIRDSGKVLTVRVTVKSGTTLGTHTFTIILANGKRSVVRYVLK